MGVSVAWFAPTNKTWRSLKLLEQFFFRISREEVTINWLKFKRYNAVYENRRKNLSRMSSFRCLHFASSHQEEKRKVKFHATAISPRLLVKAKKSKQNVCTFILHPFTCTNVKQKSGHIFVS